MLYKEANNTVLKWGNGGRCDAWTNKATVQISDKENFKVKTFKNAAGLLRLRKKPNY